MPLLPVVRRTLGLGTLAGAGLATYAAWEARQYTLRRVTVPLLPAGHAPLKVLHLSDIHMAPDQRAKQEWLRGLADLEPDLVIDTGDNLAHMRAVPVVADALGGLLDVPGVYVLGSNDYYAPGMRNPLLYLLPDTGKRNTSTPQLPWPRLKERFAEAGWLDLTDGFDAIIAGHTHGGQVCLPGGRALTTNCDLEPARARGLHRHPAGSSPGDDGSSWLHVSAGLGTNPYVRFRVACRPEATLMTLVPAS